MKVLNFFKNISRAKIWIIAILVFALVIMPTHFIRADIFGLTDIATSAIGYVISYLFWVVFAIIQNITAWLAKAFSYAVYVRAYGNIPVITETWKILRDFSNMLFVIALIWMAFATIFDVSKQRFQDLIFRFLIVAVLINFSLVIGGLVIDGCQVLTNVFLASIGNPGERLGQFLNPSIFLTAPTTSTDPGFKTMDILSSAGLSLVFGVILSAIFMFSLLVATVFAFFRIFVIWALLIVSPLAWMANIFSGTQHWFKKWWGLFFGWNLFLPVYLFFLYLGLVFLSKRDMIINAVANQYSSEKLIYGTGSYTFNTLFFYLFSAFVMAGGTAAAVAVTSKMGSGFQGGVGVAKNFVKRLPGFSSYYAAQGAAQQKLQEIQKQGLGPQGGLFNRIYGGEAATQRQQAGWAQRFGVRGAEFKNQKDFVANIKQNYDKIEDDYSAGRLDIATIRQRADSSNATSPQGFAYRKKLAQLGDGDPNRFKRTLSELESNPYALQDFIKTSKEAKFGGNRQLLDIALNHQFGKNGSDVPVRRDLLNYLKSDPKLAAGIKDVDQLGNAVRILGGKESPEAKSFLGDMAKVRPDLVYTYRKDNGMLEQPGEEATGKKSTMPTQYGAIAGSLNTEPKNIAAMPDDLWKSDAFKAALKEKLFGSVIPGSPVPSAKASWDLRNNLERTLIEQGDTDKLAVLNEVAPREKFQNQARNRQGGGQGATAQGNPPQGGRGQGTGGQRPIGFAPAGPTASVSPANVLDLKNGENNS